jgi:hypothetical protein
VRQRRQDEEEREQLDEPGPCDGGAGDRRSAPGQGEKGDGHRQPDLGEDQAGQRPSDIIPGGEEERRHGHPAIGPQAERRTREPNHQPTAI